jgi:hypothetical protein
MAPSGWKSGAGDGGKTGPELGAVSLYRGQSFVATVTGDRNGVLSFAYSLCWERCVLRLGWGGS